MARSLGKALWPDGTERFFIHCDTANHSFSRLFATAAEAEDAYRKGGLDALKSPHVARDLQVVKIALAGAWAFTAPAEWVYGLATSDRLTYCSTDDGACDPHGSARALLTVDGVMHLSETAGGGFEGTFDVEVCAVEAEYKPDAVRSSLAAAFGGPERLCPKCVAKVLSPRAEERSLWPA